MKAMKPPVKKLTHGKNLFKLTDHRRFCATSRDPSHPPQWLSTCGRLDRAQKSLERLGDSTSSEVIISSFTVEGQWIELTPVRPSPRQITFCLLWLLVMEFDMGWEWVAQTRLLVYIEMEAFFASSRCDYYPALSRKYPPLKPHYGRPRPGPV